MDTQQKTIEQRLERVVLGQMIARAHEHESFQSARFFAAPKNPFIERREQAVQNRAVGIEQFVEENERGLWQHAFGIGQQFAFTQFANIERAKQFVRFRKTGEQV